MGLGELDEIRQIAIPGRMLKPAIGCERLARAQIAGGVPAPVKQLLPLPHHPQKTVVQDHDQHGPPGNGRGGQFRARHLEGTVAVYAYDGLLGPGEFRSQRRGKAVAHRSQAARGDEMAGMVAWIPLHRPHLMLPDARGHDGVSVGEAVQLVQHVLRPQDVVVPITERMFAVELLDMCEPGLMLRRRNELEQVLQHHLQIAHDRTVRAHRLGDAGRIDIDVNLLGQGREARQFPGHAVIEACARGDEQVGLLHRHVARILAVHAERSEHQRMRRREGAVCHQRPHHRYADSFGQRLELGSRTRVDRSSSHVKNGPLGAVYQARGFLDLQRIALDARLVGADVDFFRPDEFCFPPLDIHRDVDEDRSRAARAGQVKRFAQRLRQPPDVPHQKVVLGDRPGDARGIGLLERVRADRIGADLAGDRHQGNRIHVGRREARHDIGRTRA